MTTLKAAQASISACSRTLSAEDMRHMQGRNLPRNVCLTELKDGRCPVHGDKVFEVRVNPESKVVAG